MCAFVVSPVLFRRPASYEGLSSASSRPSFLRPAPSSASSPSRRPRRRTNFFLCTTPSSSSASSSDGEKRVPGNGSTTTPEPTSTSKSTPSQVPPPGFIMWGPPGCGKTSLCEALTHTHGLVHISTGSLLRAHVLYETVWGVKARSYVTSTTLVPDDIVIPMVLERLRQPDVRDRGFLLDGFPRNEEQHSALHDAGFVPRMAIMLHAPRETLSQRIRYRRLDPETDVLYNLKVRPPVSQEVLERLIVLAKDSAANVAELFASYGRATADTFDLLSASAARVDADRGFDAVLQDVADLLTAYGVHPLAYNNSNMREMNIPDNMAAAAAIPETESTEDTTLSSTTTANANTNTTGNQVVLPPSPPPRTVPSVVTPPGVQGLAPDDQDMSPPLRKPMSEANALRARRAVAVNEVVSGGPVAEYVTKPRITLIRCDGYVCERESVDESQIAFRGAATEQVMLMWNVPPRVVLLLVKKDPELMGSVLQAARYLTEEEGLKVVVEGRVQTQALANGMFLETFSSSDALHEVIDFVVCLGGDGLILHTASLFKSAVPPVISFNLGSLGFLTPFAFEDFRAEIQALLKGICNLSLRMRLSCQVLRGGEVKGDFAVLNEVVVDRGASPYLSNLHCYCDGKYITTVQADGIIMSTPTGSTAYSMSAGGSMVHPSVPAILFTPICPHSLSFRPIVFPDSAELRIEIADGSRSHAWASFDGKARQQLRPGDGLVVHMNLFPVPTVNKTDHTGDWFQSLDRAFNFNSRAGQKPLTKKRRSQQAPPEQEKAELAEENERAEEEEDDGRDGEAQGANGTAAQEGNGVEGDYVKSEDTETHNN